jgi:carbonic anhydrase
MYINKNNSHWDSSYSYRVIDNIDQMSFSESVPSPLVLRPVHHNDPLLSQLITNNLEWSATLTTQKPEFFKELEKGQSPSILWIGCSDSRVPPSQICGLAPGDIFVHRNIANMIHPFDLNLSSVILYAVEHLKISHIIVCGHTHCGGIQACLSTDAYGLIDHWLLPFKEELALIQKQKWYLELSEKEKWGKCVELNVLRGLLHLAQLPVVRQAWESNHKLILTGWVFELTNGHIKYIIIYYLLLFIVVVFSLFVFTKKNV